MTQLLADIQYAIRQLRHAPGFAITAVLTLALGIGANSTILSWISGTLFDPIPGAKNVDSMLTIQRGERSEHPGPPFSYPDLADLRDNTRTLSGLIGYHDDYISITGSAKARTHLRSVDDLGLFRSAGCAAVSWPHADVDPHQRKGGCSDRGSELQPLAEPLCRRPGNHRKDDPAQSPPVHDRGRSAEGFSRV